MGGSFFRQASVGVLHCLPQGFGGIGGRLVLQIPADGLGNGAGCFCAALVAAHAVCQHKQPQIRGKTLLGNGILLLFAAANCLRLIGFGLHGSASLSVMANDLIAGMASVCLGVFADTHQQIRG